MKRTTNPGPSVALLCALVLPLVAANCGKQDDTSGDSGHTGLNPMDFWELESFYGAANIDDDDENGVSDWDDGGTATDNDLAELLIPDGVGDLNLTLEGVGLRVWYDGALLLDETTTTASLTGIEAKTLGVEFSEPLGGGSIGFEGGGNSNTVTLMAAPLTINHHLQTGTHMWILSVNSMGYSNASMVSDLESILGADRFSAVNGTSYSNDVWVQDEFEFGYLRAADNDAEIVVDSIRSQQGRYLDQFPEEQLQQPDRAVATWGSGSVNSLDSFGNLETSPPVTVDGVDYPLGRIYYGGDDSLHPSVAFTSFLQSQQVQAPVRPDSAWLCVGHVDEFMAFVPDSSAAKGFKFLVADVDVAWAFLESLDPSTEIPKYRSAHGFETVGELVQDQALRDLNEDFMQDEIEPVIAFMTLEMGLEESDIIRVPGIFEENSWCRNYALALIPGMVNMTVFTEAEGDNKLLIPDPFLRGSGEDQSVDPLIALWDSLMPPGNETYYLDDWDVYHEGWGEVHCGTNTHREMGADWWTDATHLLGGE